MNSHLLAAEHSFLLILDDLHVIQDFLLQTSILERLNGALCDAVTGRADSVQLLEQLLTANLFLIPLDDEGRWYRYHPLFADLLRDRPDARSAGRRAGRPGRCGPRR